MGLGNGNPKYGNKGSNFAYELANLKLLKQIVVALGGGPTPVSKTPTLIRGYINGTTPLAYSVSFYNAHATSEAGLDTGSGWVDLLPGESISFSADGEGKIGAIIYTADINATGSGDLVVSTVT